MLLALCLGTGGSIAQEGDLKRLVSGIPATAPVGYAVLLLLGVLGAPLARTWWVRVWPPEAAADYAGRTGYWAACGVRFLAFTLIFLPLTAVVAAPRSLGGQIWQVVRGPLRGLRGIAGWAARRHKAASAPVQASAGDKPRQPDAAAEPPSAPAPPPPPSDASAPLPPKSAPPPMAMPPPPKDPGRAPAFFTPPFKPPPPSAPPPARRSPELRMPPPTRVPSGPPPSAPEPPPFAWSMSAPAMWATSKPPSPKQPSAGAAWSKPAQRDEPAKPARSWIANLPKDEDI